MDGTYVWGRSPATWCSAGQPPFCKFPKTLEEEGIQKAVEIAFIDNCGPLSAPLSKNGSVFRAHTNLLPKLALLNS
jgi:hypothetical protein